MKHFLAGKKTLGVQPLQTVHSPTPLSSAGLVRPAPAATPSVELIKEGDKIVRLIVTCACGERIEVECLYPAGS